MGVTPLSVPAREVEGLAVAVDCCLWWYQSEPYGGKEGSTDSREKPSRMRIGYRGCVHGSHPTASPCLGIRGSGCAYASAATRNCRLSLAERQAFPVTSGLYPRRTASGEVVSIGVSSLSVSVWLADGVLVDLKWVEGRGRACELEQCVVEVFFLLDQKYSELALEADGRVARETFKSQFFLSLPICVRVVGRETTPGTGREGCVVPLSFGEFDFSVLALPCRSNEYRNSP